MSRSVDIRGGRYAANEVACRGVNERIRSDKERYDEADPMQFMCECAEGACINPIQASLDGYLAARSHARRFIVSAGHNAPEMEQGVGRHPRYWVVEQYADVEGA